MAVLWLVFGFTLLILLVIRFIQPDLIYGLREALVRVLTNKTCLNNDAGRPQSRNVLESLMIKDLRYESRIYDEQYIFSRIAKIRRLYWLLNAPQRRAERPKGSKDNVCIIELAETLKNLGANLPPNREGYMRPVHANELLSFLANQIRQRSNQELLVEDQAVERWFDDHPISTEQAMEVLIACVFTLRQRVTRSTFQK